MSAKIRFSAYNTNEENEKINR